MPDENLGSANIAARYKVSPQRARQLLYAMREDGVKVETISRRLVVRQSAVTAWERKRKRAGLPLPGQKRRGPRSRFAGDVMTAPHNEPKL
jgi:transposase